ncbi:hypothetical protein [Vampirovibrio chlorellavorus]|uniref:hypothetical protein n=1 Tax=Vampirovibrio chlorellavorus TaxID=758823 RepID=UPI0026EA1126|nr:hypothetical protein [Vampirovibrio chlorellavorus]
MMDYTGVSLYPVADTAEKRKAEAVKADGASPFMNRPAVSAGQASAVNPFQLYQPLQQDASTFRFKEPLAPPNPNLPQSTQTRVTPLGLLPANLAQLVNANMEKLAGQIMSFFNGNRKQKPSEEEQLNRQLNDAFGVGLLGEVVKVEEAASSQMQEGE